MQVLIDEEKNNNCRSIIFIINNDSFPKKILTSRFDLKEINIENNLLLEDKEIKKLLSRIYGKNLIFIKNEEIEKALIQNSFIESFNIKKIPNKLQIKIYEKTNCHFN